MKNMKKLFVFLLTLVMIMSLATTAMAATVVNETTHDFKAYQIFSGTQVDDHAQLGDANWGSGVNPVTLVAALKAANETLYSAVPDLTASSTEGELKAAAEAVINALIADGGGADFHADAEVFANIVVNHLKGDGVEIKSNDTSVDLNAGYYVIVDQAIISADAHDAKNPALLQVTNKGNILIAKKYQVPTLEKDIVHGSSTTKLDAHSIGDTVNFRLTATMANNLDEYNIYKLVFHDAMSAGLTFNKGSVVVKVDGVTVTDGFELKVRGEDGHTCAQKKDAVDCTFDIVFNDILAAPLGTDGKPLIKNNSVVTVDYTANIDVDAKIDIANPNDSRLEFSNDPDWTATPEKPTTPTGVTPWSEVEVFTTEVGLTKKDDDTGDILQGAEFTLTGEKLNIVMISKSEFVEATDGSYWKLTDGSYTTTDPTGEGVDTSKYASTTIKYKETVTTQQMNTQGASAVTAKAEVGADGKLHFSGLGPGVYKLVESKAPASYHTIKPIVLTVAFDKTSKQFTYAWAWENGSPIGTDESIIVFNTRGSVLPETGGVGTTMFYVCGGILVAAAIVLLITKKRSAAEK